MPNSGSIKLPHERSESVELRGAPVEDDGTGKAFGHHQLYRTSADGYAITTADFDPEAPAGETPINLTEPTRNGREMAVSNTSVTLLHAEEDGAGGFHALEQITSRRGEVSYTVRHFDSSGLQTDETRLKTSEPALVSWEDTFEADLNGDNAIGHRLTAVEDDGSGAANGDFQLHRSTTGGYAITTASFDPDAPGGEAPIDLTEPARRGQVSVVSNTSADLVQAEEDGAGGFHALEQITSRRGEVSYTVRHFDSSGLQTDETRLKTSEPALVSWEDTFEADLNGDNAIGHRLTAVEDDGSGAANGDFQLHRSTTGGYAITTASFDPDAPGGEAPIDLTEPARRGQVSVVSNTVADLVQAEEDGAGGFHALEQITSRRGEVSYTVRHFDSSGLQTDETRLKTSEPALVSWEDTFEADLNGDNAIGHRLTAVEDDGSGAANGDFQLHRSTTGGYAITTASFDPDAPGGEAPIDLTEPARRGQVSVVSNTGADLVQAEEDGAGGFHALEQITSRRGEVSYTVRHFDSSGLQTDETRLKTSEPALVSWEDTFEADLNGDNAIGHRLTAVEDDGSGAANGDFQLHRSTTGGYAITTASFDPDAPGGEAPIDLTEPARRGQVSVVSNTGADLVQAEEDGAGGFHALEQITSRRGEVSYTVRHFDSSGLQTDETRLKTSEPALVSWEETFEADLNGNGYLGEIAPTLDGPTAISIAEHRLPSATPLASFNSSGVGGLASFTIVSGNTGDAFAIDSQAQITQVTNLDHEVTGAYTLGIEGRDALNNPVSATLQVTVTDQNDAPVLAGSATPTVSFLENSVGRVFTASATDQDQPADTLVFYLGTNGGDEASFNIDPQTGALTFINPPDYESDASADGDNDYRASIQVRDGRGGIDSQMLTVQVDDEIESTPPVFMSPASLNVPENSAASVYQIEATDADSQSLSFSIEGGADAGAFSLTQGQAKSAYLHFNAPQDFEARNDANADNSFEVIVKATDGGGGVATHTVSLQLTDENEAPQFTSSPPSRILSGATGTVYTALVSDPDANDTLTFSIDPNSPDASAFLLSASGELAFVTSPNFETSHDVDANNVYDVTLVVSDSSGLLASQTVALEVVDPSTKSFSPYAYTNLLNSPLISDLVTEIGLDEVTLAFLLSSGHNQLGWAGQGNFQTNTRVNDQITAMQANNIDITISFGGYGGTEAARVTYDHAQLGALYSQVIDTYGITKLDFDIEGQGMYDTNANTRRSDVLADLQSTYPDLEISYTLPVLTTGLTSAGIAVLQTAIDANLDLSTVNIMTMNYGAGYWAGSGSDSAILASEATLAQLEQLGLSTPVVLTPMIGINDVRAEIFGLQDAQELVQYALSNDDVAGISMWSLHRDNGDWPGYLSGTSSGIVQDDFAFSSIFKSLTDPASSAPSTTFFEYEVV